MQDSVFTKIINGELPAHKIYDDERTIAFMDIHPIQPGHVLVVSKTQEGNFYDLSHQDYQALFATVQKVAKKLREVFPDTERIGVMVEGLDIAHAHVKVFPIDTADEYRNHPDMDAEPDDNALEEMARKLRF